MLAEAHGRGIRDHRRPRARTTPPTSTSGSRRPSPPRPGSRERARYLFRDGKGEHGELPPNNWESVFGGPAWTRVIEADGTPGQWYLHLFDSLAARLRLVERRGARGVPPHPAVLARPRGRRLPRRRRARPRSRPTACPTTRPPADAALDGRRRGRRAVLGPGRRARRSTATGTACSPSTTATARSCAEAWRPTPDADGASGCVPTRCTRRSTSPTSRPTWDAADAARRHRRVARAPSPPSAPRAPGCCPTTTSSATRRASR